MRTVLFLLQKEFRQIFRNKSLLPMILMMPIIQLLILPLAADYEIKNISLAVVDNDRSSYSQEFIKKITASGYFHLVGNYDSFKEAFNLIESDEADIIVEIPAHFEQNIVRESQQQLFIAVNAINGAKAGVGSTYLNQILRDYNADIRLKWIQPERFPVLPIIDVVVSNWYNPLMNYTIFMVPGILAMLVTMIGGYMSALNIVKEKEVGTIEQINVTPIKKHHFILGKLIPFWIIGIVVFTIGLVLVARIVYGIVPLGNIFLLYGFLSVYLVAVLGFGLLISTYSDTQQQAMSIAFFFIMIFNLMSGLFTPIDSMPDWAKLIAYLNPVTYFIEVLRMIVLKGSELNDILYHFFIVFLFAIGLNGWAIFNYKKTT